MDPDRRRTWNKKHVFLPLANYPSAGLWNQPVKEANGLGFLPPLLNRLVKAEKTLEKTTCPVIRLHSQVKWIPPFQRNYTRKRQG